MSMFKDFLRATYFTLLETTYNIYSHALHLVPLS